MPRRLTRAAAAAALACAVAAGAAAQQPAAPWPDYEVILWHRPATEAGIAALPRLGISGAMVPGQREGIEPEAAHAGTAPLQARGLRWYVENIATDFYSSYHRWTPGRPVNWRFLEAQRRYREEGPRAPGLFLREPGLSDPAWILRIRERLAAHARLHAGLAAPGRPLFLNLADEPGIADLAAPWDFDHAPDSLAGFRDWLRGEYGTLDALNAQWGTGFAAWEAVRPETTDEAIAREDGNHAAWSDFKAWMDIAFARAVAAGRDAVHEAGTAGGTPLLAGIAGGQRPGWGGWDYARLAPAIDVMETYDLEVGAAVAQGVHPGIVLLSTTSDYGPGAPHALWRQVMRGMRGTILWDEARGIVGAEGMPGPHGAAMAPHFAALRGGLAALLMAGRAEPGEAGILYAQQGFRMRWLLDRRAAWRRDGTSWAERTSEAEHEEENAWRAALRRAVSALARLGIVPRWLTPAMLAEGGVPEGLRALVLPHAIALSDAEAAAIRAFAARGGLVLADAAEPGLFDGRGRLRATPALQGLALRRPAALQHDGGAAEDAAAFAALLAEAGVVPEAVLESAAAAEMRVLRNGALRLVAIHRAPEEGGAPASLRLREAWHLRAVEGPPGLRHADRVALDLDGVVPSVVVLSPEARLPGPVLESGEAGAVRIGLDGPSPAAVHVLRLELLDAAADGAAPPPDRRWVVALPGDAGAGGMRDWTPPAHAPRGSWTLRATDLLSGASAEMRVEIVP